MARKPFLIFSSSLTLLRLLVSAWVGAAALFVITSVAEQTSDVFGSVVRDQLATVRFPLYYQFGFAIHFGSAAACVAALLSSPREAKPRLRLVLALVIISGILIAVDYRFVYSPLQDMIQPPGKARTPDFIRLHTWSRHMNEAHVLTMSVAALAASFPFRRSVGRGEDDPERIPSE